MDWRDPLRRYGLALAMVGFAVFLARALEQYIAPHVSPPYFLAVMIAAAYGGAGPGLLATVISSSAIAWFDLGSARGFELGLDDLIRLASFSLTALIISSISAARKSAERDLRDALETLSALDRAKDEFIATISHDLRTPLTSILGWLKILREEDLDAETRALALSSVEQSASTQAMLVNDLLDASRITLGKLHLECRPLLIRDVVADAVRVIGPAAAEKEVTIEISGTEDASIVSADRARLDQIFWNLLSNAVKFSRARGRIVVRISHDRNDAIVEISDDGEGMSAEVLPHIFERFAQGEGAAHKGGLGLGLSIVKHLVERHGGSVMAASDGPGRGATFVTKIPLVRKSQDLAIHGE